MKCVKFKTVITASSVTHFEMFMHLKEMLKWNIDRILV
jgi:hypothetical protein